LAATFTAAALTGADRPAAARPAAALPGAGLAPRAGAAAPRVAAAAPRVVAAAPRVAVAPRVGAVRTDALAGGFTPARGGLTLAAPAFLAGWWAGVEPRDRLAAAWREATTLPAGLRGVAFPDAAL
jgi:hypothetical protein